MHGLPIRQLLQWAVDEHRQSRTVFGIPVEKFYRPQGQRRMRLFGQTTALPLGPAAGPHTQLAQNIAAAYLCGSRYIELKTVQILDSLEIAKPCINARDEGYNTEWSTELSLQDARDEYVKAWFLLHFLADLLQLSAEPDFIFNMSVGYNLAGIQNPKVDDFIEGLKNAAQLPIFAECQLAVAEMAVQLDCDACCRRISPQICSSITLSTMHGCPPAEIEAISRYLLAEKGLHLYVKMNPTLLGYSWVKQTLDQLGYGYLRLKEESFQHDIGYSDAVAMLRRLQDFAADLGLEFGVKLSNTLPAGIGQGELPGEEMYLSGRALYPLTTSLAHRLAAEFAGRLPISFSGGCDGLNAAPLLAAGITPLTMATTLLKPGGYGRLSQAAASLDNLPGNTPGQVMPDDLAAIADVARRDGRYQKEYRPADSRKLAKKLPLTDCFTAPCQSGCPIGQDIPDYIRLVGEKRYTDAYRLITAKNPLPMITGEICPHPCTSKCTRLDYDIPVCIRELKKLAAVEGGGVPAAPAAAQGNHGVPVAVIGAGPAGLSAAYFLAGAGFPVTVIDQAAEAGGTVSRVIPDFRVSPGAVAHDLDLVQSRGVRFRLGADPAFSLADLRREGFKFICLALGAGESVPLAIAGDGDKIMPAVPFLAAWKADPTSLDLGKNVVVVGGGNSAMDAARAAKRLPGVETVTVVYRRSRAQMPAHREEMGAALAEGIGILELCQPVSLSSGRLTCQEMFLGEPGKDGRPQAQPLAGHFRELAADTVILAVGERLAGEILRQNGIEFTANGAPVHDPETLETSQQNVFIAGDALTGPATIVEAIAGGKRVAAAICAREGVALRDDGHYLQALPNDEYPDMDAAIQRKKGVLRPGYMPDREEADRCLECSRLCNICAEVCPNRANIAVRTGSGGLRDTNQIVHLDALCNECGNCATFCPYDGAPYRDKLTLFANELDFAASSNSGFYLAAGTDRAEFTVRHDDRICRLTVEDDGRVTGVQPGDEGVAAVLSALWQQQRYLFY